jgi:hypothetical protein
MAEEALDIEVENEDGEWGTISTVEEEKEKPVEFEVSEDTEEEETVKVKSSPEDVEDSETTDESPPKELEGIETQGAQKRIRRLVQQRKERESTINALEQRIQDYEAKLKERDNELVNVTRQNLDASTVQLNEQIELAEESFRQALEEGDANKIVAAQKTLNRAEINLNNLKTAQAAAPEVTENTEATAAPVVQGQTYENAPYAPDPNDYDPKAVAYAESNAEWFGTNQTLTAAALGFNQQLLDEGYDPSDDDFYDEIDKRMKTSYPKFFEVEEVQETQVEEPEVKAPSKSSQVVGGASRTVSNPGTGRNKRVKLTQKDVETANKWGIPLERYAEQKLVADQAEGEYTTINTAQREG